MPKPIVVPYRLREVFLHEVPHYKIVFFSAGTGWGKTAVVRKLLEKQNVAYLSLRKNALPSYFSKERLIVLDDFQELPPQMEGRLQGILRKSPRGQHFILLSRGPLPDYLSLYEANGTLLQLGIGYLALDPDSLAQLIQAHGLTLSTHDSQRLLEETDGCPAAVNLLLLLLSYGQPFCQQTVDAMVGKMGAYIDQSVLRLLGPKVGKLLTELSLFDRFDQALAEELVEDGEMPFSLESLCRCSGLIQPCGGAWSISDRRFLLPYLQGRLHAENSSDRIRAIHWIGGRWYALRHDFRNALYHYQQAESRAEILKALAQNARLHPGIGAYYEMQDYYLQLTEDEIRSSPDMICAMSMLCSMTFDPEGAEKWYKTLKEYVRSMDRQDSDYPRVRGLLTYLEISLPHRGIADLDTLIPAASKLLRSKTLILPEMSVTSNLPSILRGGKDFSEWVLRDKFFFHNICTPVEKVLGRLGAGLWEIALAEIRLERGEDISGQFLALMALQKDLQTKGTPEMEFVLTALLVRTLISAGNTDKAKKLLLQFRSEMEKADVSRLLPNIDAMLCRLSLLEDSAFASVWFSEHAPSEESFYGMERYRYLAKVRCYIKSREHHSALLLLGRMLDYTQRYNRPLDMLEILVLISICRFRMGSEDWREHFDRALKLGGKYDYLAVFTREGAALLPLLEHYDHKSVEQKYWERILSGTVVQARYYTQYLRPLDSSLSCLTQTETLILRLICQDKRNEEICTLLNIKLSTAKTHVRNLFKKLKVASRAEAQKAAKRMGLI